MSRSVNVHIHLLANINRSIGAMKRVDHLQHAPVNAFGAVAGKRRFRQDIPLESNEFKRCADMLVATEISNRCRVGPQPPSFFSSTSTRT